MSFIFVKYISTFKTQEIAKYLFIANISLLNILLPLLYLCLLTNHYYTSVRCGWNFFFTLYYCHYYFFVDVFLIKISSFFTYSFECNITLCIGIGRMHNLKLWLSLLIVLQILSDINL